MFKSCFVILPLVNWKVTSIINPTQQFFPILPSFPEKIPNASCGNNNQSPGKSWHSTALNSVDPPAGNSDYGDDLRQRCLKLSTGEGWVKRKEKRGRRDEVMLWARARWNALGVPDALSRERIQAYRVSVTRDISHLNAPGTITLYVGWQYWLVVVVRHRETGLNHWSGDNRLEVCGNSLVVDSRARNLRAEHVHPRVFVP